MSADAAPPGSSSGEPSRSGRIPVLALVVTGIAMALVVGAWQLYSTIVGESPFDFLRPTAADVLDGRVSSGERLAALESVATWMDSNEIAGTTKVGRSVYSYCDHGKNDWKVHEGFRLRCTVTGRQFSAWSGDFGAVRDNIRAGIGARCVGPSDTGEPVAPRQRVETHLGTYACPDGSVVYLRFATPQGITPDDSILAQAPCVGDYRCAAGSSSQQLLQSLDGSEWFVVQLVTKQFYEDQP